MKNYTETTPGVPLTVHRARRCFFSAARLSFFSILAARPLPGPIIRAPCRHPGFIVAPLRRLSRQMHQNRSFPRAVGKT
jgi:hypothetical protein